MFQEFHSPTTVQEALKLRQASSSSMYYGGGTEINSRVWPCRPLELPFTAVSLARLPLTEITPGTTGISIGSGVVIQRLLETPGLPPLLVAAARNFANRNVRNMGTLGGNIGSLSSCSNIVPALLALDASVKAAGPKGEETLSLVDYIARADRTFLVLSIEIPSGWEKRRWATKKHSRTANDVSIVSVSVSFAGDASRVDKPVIAVSGVAPRVIRLGKLEAQLDGKPLPPREETDAAVKTLVSPPADLRGGAEFKRHLAAVMVSDALKEAAAGGRGAARAEAGR